MRNESVAGAIISGGLGRRMGSGVDKPLRLLGDRPVLEHVIERTDPQVATLMLNVNGDPTPYQRFGLTIVTDDITGGVGPLAGILASLAWLRRNRPDLSRLATFPGDTPFLPNDLVDRLGAATISGDGSIIIARSGERRHPICGLWPAEVEPELRHAIEHDGLRRVDDLLARHRVSVVEFPTDPVDPFFNINTPEDLRIAHGMLPA